MIKENSVVSMTYVLRDDKRMIMDASVGSAFMFLQGHQNIIPGLEKALMGLKPGDHKMVEVNPEDGYGNYNPEMKMSVPREQFGDNVPEVGRQIQLNSPNGPFIATIVGIENDQVELDANHPLAGKKLFFEVDIMDVREATPDEIQHGHPHDPNNPHHH
jgi:FKBP-type peptidyl-prolyl cis-trans isomerase SlyD